MVNYYSVERIEELAVLGADKSRTTKERGDALEDLFCYLLDAVPGITTRRNGIDRARSTEIDITVANNGVGDMRPLPGLFLVECKNWDCRVDVPAVQAFIGKLDKRAVELGILVAANGVTGERDKLTAVHHELAMAQQRNRRVLIATLDDIRKMPETQSFAKYLVQRLLTLVATGGQ